MKGMGLDVGLTSKDLASRPRIARAALGEDWGSGREGIGQRRKTSSTEAMAACTGRPGGIAAVVTAWLAFGRGR
ncbi:hypothetical protein E2562_004886 [Oryza meyeriana var. granulata]|uniref:Uncharacterized protein n=1 Tax=Oryza meyeriana var. granulata TaxID=110450 RepID=A0A6G1C348_9ORYZ|nr:hypothetical protein E2562_004886 [Oryza meyeriana var. granulata]